MSKIHNTDHLNHHEKRKLRKAMRRYETENIKRRRFFYAKNYINGIGGGYYIKDERKVGEIHKINYPETKEIIGYEYHTGYKGQYDKNGNFYKIPHTYAKPIYETKPARSYKYSKIHYVDIKPYVKRYSIKKKLYKHITNCKIRHYKLDENISNSKYKKLFDLVWEIW